MTLKDQTRWKATVEEGEYVIRGKRGVIAQYEDGSLNVWITNTRIATKAQIVFRALHTYDDGADFNIHNNPDDMDKACGWIKARKRRQVTEAMRQRGRDHASNLTPKKKNTGLAGLSAP